LSDTQTDNSQYVYNCYRILDSYFDFKHFQYYHHENPKIQPQVTHRFRDLLKYLDISGQYVCGDAMSVADFCLAALYLEVVEKKKGATNMP
jgi:glutathione S-transferase